ncbi:MAG: DNA polymerase I [Lachnospiraceae bacterium]|nr:DNA polymerase I [Lachnospiraceae bacterium]
MSRKMLLIDGNSIINRAFYGLPDLTNSSGMHTNAVLGFLNIFFKILDEEKPDNVYVAFDVKSPTFRHEMFKEYKGTRKPMPEELREQLPLLKEVLHAMGICIVERAGYEADDILGTLARQGEENGFEVALLSGDRDLLQIATDKIKIRIPKTHKGTTEIFDYYAKDVEAEYQVTPIQFIDMKALMGDTSDNIPGLPGVGPKTAGKIIAEYKSIENAYDNLENITPNKAKEAFRDNYELVKLCKVLATIKTDCELEVGESDSFENGKLGDIFTKELYDYFIKLEFKSLINKYFADAKPENSLKDTFRRISDWAEADAFFGKAANKAVGVFFLKEGELKGVAIATDKETVYIETVGFITEEYLKGAVDELRTAMTTDKIYCVDIKSQLPYWKPERKISDFDAGIAAYIINPLEGSYEYDELARDYLGMTLPSKKELLGNNASEEALMEYACYQASVALLSGKVLRSRLAEEDAVWLYEEIELPLLYTLYNMEAEGIRVEREALKEYGDKLSVRINELEKEIYALAGEEFNINSPKQLGEILFEKLKLSGGKKTKSGYSTAADVLEKLAGEHAIVNAVLEYRQLAKLKSTYADGLAVFISEDGRIHGKFNQTITATGRISSTEPNLQNIPVRMELGRRIRKVFVPREDYVFVDADYSQIELRVLAHMSQDANLIAAYKQDEDIHKITASQVFHIPFDEVTPEQRRSAKAVNFGIVYGISSFGLSQDIGVSRKEATEYIERYFEVYPGIKKYLDFLVDSAKENGYVKTLFGRKRPIPELKSSNFMQRSFGERIAMNSPIQGTAADIIKIAMIRVDERLRKDNYKSRLLLQVHDELLIEAYKPEVDEVCAILKEEMERAAELSVDLCVDMNIGNDWFEAK